MAYQEDEQTQEPTNQPAGSDTPLGIDNPNPTPPTAPKSRKPLMLVVVAVLLAVLLVGLILTKPDKQAPAPQNTTQTPASTALQSATVNITAKGFSPATIKVKKGQSVTWVNQDSKPHQVATDPYPSENGLAGFKSPEPQNKDETYSFTFNKTGKFTYHDRLNPFKLKGTVVVE